MNSLKPENWVDRYADYLYNYAYYRVNKQELAEDLVQDTFLSALKALDSYKGEAAEKTWLVSILKNKIIDYYKKASTRNETSLELNFVETNSYEAYFNPKKNGHWQNQAKPKQWADADSGIENKELQKALEKCMQELPEKWRGIFSMSMLDEEDAKIVCKEFNLSSSNFWVIIHRAKLQLRACLEQNWLHL
jgi:RNA polymerase sigma-70 factor (ECF subfamily)